MADPRVLAVDGFTKQSHQSMTPEMDPSKVRLPELFTVCISAPVRGQANI